MVRVTDLEAALDFYCNKLGLTEVRVVLHPEVAITVTANVARSQEEATRQARGERVTVTEEAQASAPVPGAEELLEQPPAPPP